MIWVCQITVFRDNQTNYTGLPAQILKLKWPSGSNPTELSNFESIARELRYRALGRACYAHGIQPLLTAHHEDDQVETALISLLRGGRGMDLHGTLPSANIPECFGIHGVYQSGGKPIQLLPPENAPSEEPGRPRNPPKRQTPIPGNTPPVMETGGVRLYRPFLDFSKSRLIETSVKLDIPWFEDKTNADPTLTLRNTIRHFYRKNMMPDALSKSNILRMIGRMQGKQKKEKAELKSIFDSVSIEEFDTVSGTLTVRIPKILTGSFESEAGRRELNHESEVDHESEVHHESEANRESEAISSNESETFDHRESEAPNSHETEATSNQSEPVINSRMRIAASLLRTLIYFVTPQESIRLSSLGEACRIIFPNLFSEPDQVPEIAQPSSFTICGVRFERQSIPLHGKWLSERPTSWALDTEFLWILSRQPYHSNSFPQVTFPPGTSTFVFSEREPDWSKWHLYDGRFWIRVKNQTRSPIILRPFVEEDMIVCNTSQKSIRGEGRQMKPLSTTSFKSLLKKHAFGPIRYTLPALATTEDGEEKWIGLPSLDIAAEGVMEKGVAWEVRYKNVHEDTDELQTLIREGAQRLRISRHYISEGAHSFRIRGRYEVSYTNFSNFRGSLKAKA